LRIGKLGLDLRNAALEAEGIIEKTCLTIRTGFAKKFFLYRESGGMSEWFKEAVLKTVVPREWDRGFESLSLRQLRHRDSHESGPIRISQY
jgi:hypothetical protein